MQLDRKLALKRLEDIFANFENRFYRPMREDERREFEAMLRILREALKDEDNTEKAAD